MKRVLGNSILLIAMVTALLVGVTWLINLRFESGDSYPRGSSMRADPLGSKALYISYDELSGVTARRNFEPFNEVDSLPSDAMLLFLNTHGSNMYALAHNESIERFVAGGGDLVVALNPDQVAYKYIDESGDFIDEEEDEGVSEEEDIVLSDEALEEEVERTAFERRATEMERQLWGSIGLIHGEHEGGDAEATEVALIAELPETLPWREGGALVDFGEDWEPLYQIGEDVVMAQRMLKRGRIILMTDDFLFSNEAMMKHRYPSLLTWALGDQRQVVFDETHLGVAESTGVAILMRRYGLGGFFIGFAFFVVLIVWRGMSPLLPAYSSRTRGNIILAEHSIEAGLSDLVRRSVPVSDLPVEAFRQWKLSFLRNDADRAYYASEVKEAEAVVSDYLRQLQRKRKPAETHLKIQSIINRKKRKRL